MTIRVQAPNGDIIEFPDGTPDGTINAAMAKEYGNTAGKPGGFDESAPVLPGFRPPPSETTAAGDQQLTQMGTGEDVARSFAGGVQRGVAALPGLPGSLEALGRRGINTAARTVLGHELVSPEPVLPTSEDVIAQAERTPTGMAGMPPVVAALIRRAGGTAPEVSPQPFHDPQTTAGRYAETVGEFAPLGLTMPTGATTRAADIAARTVGNTALPALASEAAGQATEGTPYEVPSRVAAALLAPYAPRTAMRVVTPLPASEARTAAATALRDEGVDLTAGQRTGNRLLRYAESTAAETPLAGPNVADTLERQGEQFTRAALRRVDEVGPQAADATAGMPELAAHRQRIGGEFNRLMTNNDIVFTGRAGKARGHTLSAETLRLEAEYNATVPDALQRNPLVQDLVDDVNNAIAQGRLAGTSYQPWRSRLSRMADANRSDPEFARFAAGMRNALDNAMESGLSAGDQAAWQRARREYRHLMVLEDAIASAGADAALGVVTPQQLGRAARSGNREGYAEGRVPYADLAHAGNAALERLPNSGTPARLNVSSPSLTGLMIGGTAGRVVGSPGMQGYLGNQLLADELRAYGRTRPGAVARALMLPAEMPDTLDGR